jgi:hypothetical protein
MGGANVHNSASAFPIWLIRSSVIQCSDPVATLTVRSGMACHMTEPVDATDTIFEAVRFGTVTASATYPIVSAWEFDSLKEEAEVRKRWNDCTIYMIVQRPLTYFDNVVIDGKFIYFEIADGDKPPLSCRINLVTNQVCGDDETVTISVGFHADTVTGEQPFRNVAAIQVFGRDERFILWWSPQKILYEMLVNDLGVEIAEGGDPFAFLDFKVHYIGKNFSQKVWNRLAGHGKKQKILTLEREVGSAPEARAPLEISLVILGVTRFDDMPMIGDIEGHPLIGAAPIIQQIDLAVDGAYERFMMNSPIKLGDAALTSEVEAMLIHQFRPSYNDVKFDSYPYIKSGMRAAGYSWTGLSIKKLPALLYTDHCVMMPANCGQPLKIDDGNAPADWSALLGNVRGADEADAE